MSRCADVMHLVTSRGALQPIPPERQPPLLIRHTQPSAGNPRGCRSGRLSTGSSLFPSAVSRRATHETRRVGASSSTLATGLPRRRLEPADCPFRAGGPQRADADACQGRIRASRIRMAPAFRQDDRTATHPRWLAGRGTRPAWAMGMPMELSRRRRRRQQRKTTRTEHWFWWSWCRTAGQRKGHWGFGGGSAIVSLWGEDAQRKGVVKLPRRYLDAQVTPLGGHDKRGENNKKKKKKTTRKNKPQLLR